jgi:hypothetical protein
LGFKEKMTYIPEVNIEFTWTLLDRDISQFINDGNLNVDADFKSEQKYMTIKKVKLVILFLCQD